MWLYIQTWLPILSISLTAAICFGVASFVMGQEKSGTFPYRKSNPCVLMVEPSKNGPHLDAPCALNEPSNRRILTQR